MSQFYVWPRLGVTHPQWTCLDGVANGQGLEAAAAPREECIISPENLERLIAIHTTTAGTPPQTLETPQSPPVDMDAVADATAADFKARALAAEYQDADFIELCWRCACRPWQCACRQHHVTSSRHHHQTPPPSRGGAWWCRRHHAQRQLHLQQQPNRVWSLRCPKPNGACAPNHMWSLRVSM